MASDEQDQAEALDDDEMAGEYPPDRLLGANQYGITGAEERWDEPLDERISREEPDFGETEPVAGEPGLDLVDGDLGDGQYAAVLADVDGTGDEAALDPGDIAFGDTTQRDVVQEREAPLAAEEAAMHIVDEP